MLGEIKEDTSFGMNVFAKMFIESFLKRCSMFGEKMLIWEKRFPFWVELLVVVSMFSVQKLSLIMQLGCLYMEE